MISQRSLIQLSDLGPILYVDLGPIVRTDLGRILLTNLGPIFQNISERHDIEPNAVQHNDAQKYCENANVI
jgi:hypothetical protein